ncbi:MAG: TetR/AcrR family transcriptional regulator [Elusimicrobia bacterium]|nr:TetR/AcrR family transcriptional regulator [Elusimicrobiota bacterium]
MNSPFNTNFQPESPRTKSEERLVGAARDLFFQHGVKRITVEEICKGAGVSKMTFYRHFPDKTAVALRVLEEEFSRRRRKMREIEVMDLPLDVKLRQIFEAMIEQSRSQGPGFFAEMLKGADPALERYIEEERSRTLQQVRNLFVTAQRLGEVRKDVKVDLILRMLDAARDAMLDGSVRNLYADETSLTRETLSLFFEGVIRR